MNSIFVSLESPTPSGLGTAGSSYSMCWTDVVNIYSHTVQVA